MNHKAIQGLLHHNLGLGQTQSLQGKFAEQWVGNLTFWIDRGLKIQIGEATDIN
jgi:hypothetical protein